MQESVVVEKSNYVSEEVVAKPRLNCCLVSTITSQSLGGLASYMRFLLNDLCGSYDVSAVGRFQIAVPVEVDYAACEMPHIVDNGQFQTRIIAPRPAFRPFLSQLHHLTSRPLGRGMAIRTFGAAYQAALASAIPSGADIVHYVGTGWELLGFAALAEARKRRAVFTVLPAVHPNTWGDNPLDVRLYNQADAVLTLSNDEARHLATLGVEKTRLWTIGLAPATQDIGDGSRFRAKYKLAQRPLILFIGRKNRGKGYHTLCEAMPMVLDAVPDACLVAVGPDLEPPYPPVPNGALLDLGRADEQEKADAQAACDVFCMPSTDESFGIAYVEAWAHGKPVIGGPAPAVRELVTEGINGFCVSQDKREIAGTLIRLLRDPAFAARLGEAGRKLQRERYTWDAVTAAHTQIWEQMLLNTHEGGRQNQ